MSREMKMKEVKIINNLAFLSAQSDATGLTPALLSHCVTTRICFKCTNIIHGLLICKQLSDTLWRSFDCTDVLLFIPE
jgi:hypothetical protein